MLTRSQAEILNFIRKFQVENGYSPSYDEIAEGVGIKSRSAIHRTVHQLRDRGFVTFRDRKARSIEVLRTMEGPI